MIGLSARRAALLIALPVLLIATAVFATATIERDSAIISSRQQAAGQAMLTAMLDEDSGAKGYFATHQIALLAPWYEGQQDFAAAVSGARSLVGGDAQLLESVNQQAQRNALWRNAVAQDVARLRDTGRQPSVATADLENDEMNDFRQLNSQFAAQLQTRRDSALNIATWLAVAVAALLSIVLVVGGSVLLRRMTKREARRLSDQQELRELLQVSASEEESQRLLIRHVERIVVGSGAAVFNRNNSDDRLEPRLSENVAETPLQGLETHPLKPRSCMAVRLSRAYVQRAGDESLLPCEACGKIAGDRLCEPLLVGGQVIGSVLVAREQRIGPGDEAHVHDSVAQAAPILANQRNLALAELRASSDSLTGLPNRRAADDALKRLAAQAGRTLTPFSVVLVDLDHFKRVNDLYGHDLGDKALASVSQILATGIRASDFAARYGGEEFLILLPDTDRTGAVELAEKLRRSIELADIYDVGTLTASFGIATLPDDAVEPNDLVRKADRALYAAKARGRNRVEASTSAPGNDPGSDPGSEPSDGHELADGA